MQMTKKSKSAKVDILAVAIESIKKGKIAEVIDMMDAHPSLVDSEAENGVSLLMYATYYKQSDLVYHIAALRNSFNFFENCILGHLENAKIQVAKNPSIVNEFSGDGFTPLIYACFFGQFKLVEYLLENGAEINQQAKNTTTVTPLHSAVSGNHFQIVRFLLHKKAKVNMRQIHGRMPLHIASLLGNNNIVEMLIEYGAHVNVKTEDGRTPMAIALEKGFKETAEIIESYGGKI